MLILAAVGGSPRGGIFVGAGWSSPVARQAHNLKVAGSNPAPATNQISVLRSMLRSSNIVVSALCPQRMAGMGEKPIASLCSESAKK